VEGALTFLGPTFMLYSLRLKIRLLYSFAGAVSDVPATGRSYANAGTSETAPTKDARGSIRFQLMRVAQPQSIYKGACA